MTKPSNQSASTDNKKPAESPQELDTTLPVLDRELTRKQKELVRVYTSDPKITKTDAYKQVYNSSTTNKQSLYHQASAVFRKPQVQSQLAKYTELVESTLIGTVEDWGRHEKPRQREIAIDTAKFVHDKIHGRATQRIEQQTTGITFKIDLTAGDDTEPISEPNAA